MASTEDSTFLAGVDPHFEVRCLRSLDGPARVVVHGEIDLMAVDALHQHLAPLAQAGTPTVLDLRPVTFLDSSGIRALVHYAKLAHAEDWSLAMLAPNGPAMQTLQLCGVEDALPLSAD